MPLDSFWMIGGLPDQKLRQLEKTWQEDTRQVLLEADARAADLIEASLASQRKADAQEASRAMRRALVSQRKEHEALVSEKHEPP